VALEYSTDNDDFFANELVSYKSILVRYSGIRGLLHEFSSKDLNIAVILNENSILLDVVFVPQEQVIFEGMLDGSNQAFIRSFNNLDHRIVN